MAPLDSRVATIYFKPGLFEGPNFQPPANLLAAVCRKRRTPFGAVLQAKMPRKARQCWTFKFRSAISSCHAAEHAAAWRTKDRWPESFRRSLRRSAIPHGPGPRDWGAAAIWGLAVSAWRGFCLAVWR